MSQPFGTTSSKGKVTWAVLQEPVAFKEEHSLRFLGAGHTLSSYSTFFLKLFYFEISLSILFNSLLPVVASYINTARCQNQEVGVGPV